jgi:hypothetical protein
MLYECHYVEPGVRLGQVSATKRLVDAEEMPEDGEREKQSVLCIHNTETGKVEIYVPMQIFSKTNAPNSDRSAKTPKNRQWNTNDIQSVSPTAPRVS